MVRWRCVEALKKNEKKKLRRKLESLLADYNRLIEETNPMFKNLIQEECLGSIRMLRSIIEEL